MKQWLVTAAVLALAACNQGGGANTAANTAATNAAPAPTDTRTAGGAGPLPAAPQQASAENPVPEGFYRLQDVEGNWDGMISAICYAHGNGHEVLGERISYSSTPY